MKMLNKTSIIIVNWNTRDILRDCLESVYQQTDPNGLEVIVVDNASSDGSQEMVRQDFPQVRLIANEENRGFAAANNQGMEIAKGRYVLLLNSDTIVLDEAVAKAITFADKHPDAAVMGCRVLNADRSLQPTCFMFPSLLNLLLSGSYLYKVFPKSKFFGRERMWWWQRDDVREVDVVTGCFMLVRKEAIEQVGMMDDQYFMYGEETDWCYRFKRAGWKVLFTPDAEIIHLGGASSKQIRPQMLMQLRGSILLFIRKHHSRPYYWLACLLVSLFFIIRVPYWTLRGLVRRSSRNRDWQNAKAYLTAAVRSVRGYRALCFKKTG